jgi:putative DNA primase/helicase
MALIRRLNDLPRVVSSARATATAKRVDENVEPLYQPKEKSQARPEAEQPKPLPLPKPHAPFMDDDPIEDDGRPPQLSYGAPYDNARAYARRHCWQDGSLAMFYWGDKFWEWDGRIYEEVTDADLKARVYPFLDGSVRLEITKEEQKLVRFRPKPTHVKDLIDGLKAGLALPAWAAPPMHLDTGLRAGGVLMFKNGLLDLGTGKMVPATPKHWIHHGLEYEWKPGAPCPEWNAFLESIFPKDQQSKDAVEELLGLSMTEDVSFQKGVLLIGATRGGKGTIIQIGEALCGSYINVDLNTWMQGKDREGLIGKKMLAFPDERLKEPQWYGAKFDPGGIDHRSQTLLLKITSADEISLPQMYDGVWKGRLFGKVWIATNKTPNFNDQVLAITRWIYIAFEISFLGREDLTLADRIIANELPGVAGRCLGKYHGAKARGKLTQPDSGLHLRTDVVKTSDPFTQFMLETFVADPNGTVIISEAYKELLVWNRKRGGTLTEKIIPQNFRKYVRGVAGFQYVESASRPRDEEGNPTPRRYAGMRFRDAKDRDKEFDGDDED